MREENLEWVFTDDSVEVRGDTESYRALFAGILRRAIFDWVLYRGHHRPDKRRLAGAAYSWIFFERESNPFWSRRKLRGLFSFVSVCECLGLDPDRVQIAASRMTPRHIACLGRPATHRKVKEE